MNQIKLNYALVSVIYFIVFIALAHWFAPENYSWIRRTISDLGSQGYSNNIIMQSGFIGFGILLAFGIIRNGVSRNNMAILVYAVCVAFTGIFSTKPLQDTETYWVLGASLHSLFAQLAGWGFSIGILIQLYYSKESRMKSFHLIFFLFIIGFSLLFNLIENYQGIAQRALYACSVIWLSLLYKH